MPLQQTVLKAALRARATYVPRRYCGNFVLFRAKHRNPFMVAQQRLGWSAVAGKEMVWHDMPGDHFTFDREPHVAVLAAYLRKCIDAALGECPRLERTAGRRAA